jgi:putative endonuclease
MNALIRAVLNRVLGQKGETHAASFLRKKGFRILARGYRTHQGELDLIARDGDTVVFVEVKARRHGQPAEAVTPEKQRRLTLAALHFLHRHKLLEQRCRFDVVTVLWPNEQREPTIEHIVGAFEAVGRGQMFR